MNVKMMNSGVCAVMVAAAVSGGAGFGQVPTYCTFQLQARANLCANEPQGYNLPCNASFNSSTPVINDQRQVAVKLISAPQGVWFGSNGAGTTVASAPSNAFISDPSVNAHGYIVYPQTDSPQNGIYYFDSVANTGGLLTNQPLGSTSWGGVVVNDLGQVGYRANFSGPQAYYSFQAPSSLQLHAADASAQPGSPYSFLFTPTFNNKRQIAAHVRLGAAGQTGNSQPDQIIVFDADGTTHLIAEDVDSNPASPYVGFDSSAPALLDDGRVAFMATLAGNVRGVFLSNGVTTLTIAQSNSPGVSAIEFFPPFANDSGLVVFRGRDAAGLDAIFVGDGKTLRRVIGEHDLVPSDLGTARIDQHDNSVVFGGAVSINSHGDIAFNCALAPPDNNQIEWGSGIYIAYADAVGVPGDITGDGLVNVNDLLAVINQWGECPPPPQTCPADVAPHPDGDGVVNVNDLLLVINNWG